MNDELRSGKESMPSAYAEERNIVFPENARAQRYSSRQMKETMSKTIEAIVDQTATVKRAATVARAKQLIANWQTGFESGGLVQRKLRLGFSNLPGQQVVN